jgi:hypothetical protein
MKKILVVAALIVAGVWVIKKTEAGEWIREAIACGKAAFAKEETRESKIKQAHKLVGNLDKEIRKQFGPLAQRKVGIKELEDEVASLRKQLTERKVLVKSLCDQIDSAIEPVSVGDQFLSIEEARTRLKYELKDGERIEDRLKSSEDKLKNDREILHLKERKLNDMIDAKYRLETELSRVELREAQLDGQNVSTTVEIGDSALEKARNLLKKISRDQDIEKVRREIQTNYETQGGLNRGRTPPAVTTPPVDTSAARAWATGKGTSSTSRVSSGK